MKIRKYIYPVLFVIAMFIFMGTSTRASAASSSTVPTDDVSDGDLVCVNRKVLQESISTPGQELTEEQFKFTRKALDTKLNSDASVYTVSSGDSGDPARTVQWSMEEPITLKGYAFWTANGNLDSASPKTWKLYGTNDDPDGECEWVILDEVEDGNLPVTGKSALSPTFHIANPGEYINYKIVITNSAGDRTIGNNDEYKFRELILYAEKDKETKELVNVWDKIDQTSITGDEGVKESNGLKLALDNDIKTKWCVSTASSESGEDASRTLQWAMTKALTLEGYAFVTGGDVPGRDPLAWTLYGSNDLNGEWMVLSNVTEANLPTDRRATSTTFSIENPGEYQYYKMIITENRALRNKESVCLYQFSELLLFAEKIEEDDDEAVKPKSELVFETDDTELRILLASDTHHTYLQEWYGVSSEERMQNWVKSIKKEHAENPFDLILLCGDYSLDYWISGGSVLKDGISTAKTFMEDYASQLPEDIPIFILPGNHDLQTEETWFEMTGNYRSGTVLLGDTLFILPDTYGAVLEPAYKSDGVYTPIDVAWVKEMMDKYPDTDVYIVAHYIDLSKESEEFQALVGNNDRIKGMFMGHTHANAVVTLNKALWSNKTIAQTGNFSYYNGSADLSANFWGFRELVIMPDAAYSQYIIVESDADTDGDGDFEHLERQTVEPVIYYGEVPEIEIAGPYDSLSEYVNVYDKIDQSSITGDAGVSEEEGLNAAFDGDIYSKYCVSTVIGEDGTRTIQWAMTEPVALDAYAFFTGNDASYRDPWAWTLYGSNDPDGEEWTELSKVLEANEDDVPEERYTVTSAFSIDDSNEYQYYKFVITDNREHRSIEKYGHYQFSELVLLQDKDADDDDETGNDGGTGDSGEIGDSAETGDGGETENGGETGDGSETENGGETGDGGETENGGETGDGGETGNGGETGDGGETGNGGETGDGGETGNGGETESGSEAGNSGSTQDSESDTGDDDEDAASDSQGNTDAQDQVIQSVNPPTGDSNLHIGWWILAAIMVTGLIVFLLGKRKLTESEL